jgi:hypothetical protein
MEKDHEVIISTTTRPGAQPLDALGEVAAIPDVLRRSADPEVPARQCDVAGDFLNMMDDREPTLGLTVEWGMRVGHR